jgi:hypothetical protein
MDGFEVQLPRVIPTDICNRACAMEATLVYSDTKLESIIIDGITTSGLDILVEQNCSVLMKNKFYDHLAQSGACTQQQLWCIAALLCQKHLVADSSWDDLKDDVELWDSAVEEVLAAYPEPFAITIQNTESNSIQLAA